LPSTPPWLLQIYDSHASHEAAAKKTIAKHQI
jgi:hypothetical protein